ncbi:MAG: hypothetical protein ORN49_02360, partial [Rhodobacteraceae bacterium]|nr:hypothetical protein [Paracoccaceae bacterium]
MSDFAPSASPEWRAFAHRPFPRAHLRYIFLTRTGVMMTGEETPGRSVIRLSGADRESFLQGLVSNDLRRLKAGAVYAAFLSPQGKYLADFLLIPDEGSLLLDIASPQADPLLRRLS